MQTRRLLYSPCCIGVAPLWVGSGKNSVRRSPSTSLTRGRLQTFTPPLSALPGSSNRKQRGNKERSPSLVVANPALGQRFSVSARDKKPRLGRGLKCHLPEGNKPIACTTGRVNDAPFCRSRHQVLW